MSGRSSFPPGGETLLAGTAVVFYAALVPLIPVGGYETSAEPQAAGALAAIAAAVFPAGDGASRGRLAAVFAAAIGLSLVARFAGEGAAARSARGGHPHGEGSDGLAGLAATGVVAVATGYLALATRSAPGAVSVTVVAGALLLMVRVAQDPGAGRSGLVLGVCAGLCAGEDGAAAAVAWPPAAAVTLWALRRGERWPLVAPLAFAAGSGASLALAVGTWTGAPPAPLVYIAHALSLGPLREALSSWWVGLPSSGLPSSVLPSSGLPSALSSVLGLGLVLGREMGMVASLLALVGVAVLFGRRPGSAILVLWTAAAGLTVAAASRAAGMDGRTAFSLATVALAPAIAAGISALSAVMGRARLATTAALGIIALVEPVFGSVAALFPRR